MHSLLEVMAQLEKLGSAQQRKTYANHGAKGDFYGVKIGDLKPIARSIMGDQELCLALYATGNFDAMYLAGLGIDAGRMSRKELERWLKEAGWEMISEYTVPWVTAESAHARELALKWIDSPQEKAASAGWNTYSSYLAITADEALNLEEIGQLLDRVAREIRSAPNRVKYCMNNFVISVGGYVKPLLGQAKSTARTIGKVEVDMGNTECKVPLALGMIEKIESMGRVGKKRATARC
jgi:hypothetical protein